MLRKSIKTDGCAFSAATRRRQWLSCFGGAALFKLAIRQQASAKRHVRQDTTALTQTIANDSETGVAANVF
jgi:hypothetical protein